MERMLYFYPFALLFMSATPTFATDGAEIRWAAQLWMKETTSAGDAVYYPMGEKVRVELTLPLSAEPRVLVVKKHFQAGDLSATVTFYRVNAADGQVYITTQTRLSHQVKTLVAECSRYDSPASKDIGIGSCSGAVDGRQYGISFLKE